MKEKSTLKRAINNKPVEILHDRERKKEMNTLEFEMSKKYRKLRPSEKKVADYLLAYKGDVNKLTITGLAEAAGVSQPTIIRFTKAMGLDGFKELKWMMLQEALKNKGSSQDLNPLNHFNISEEDELIQIPSKVIAITMKSMQDTLKSISVPAYTEAVSAIVRARNVFVFGVENSKSTVNDLVTKLLYLGIHCISYDDCYLQSICASHLTAEDVAIGISYSGYSKDTIDVMKIAKKSGATTIALTNCEDSAINQFAQIVLSITQEQYMYGDAIFSRTSQIVMVDMIYSGILVSDYKKYTKKMDLSSQVISERAYPLDEDKCRKSTFIKA